MIQVLSDLFEKAQRSVTHLEMRDTYGTSSESYQAWLNGKAPEEFADFAPYIPWVELIGKHVKRGVSFRRARVISEPVSDYIRFEHAVTPYSNLAGGEQVRWLPRPRARDIAVPGADFWQMDDALVCFVHQTGDGEKAGYDLSEDPLVAKLCSSAFEAIWEQGIDHQEYRPA